MKILLIPALILSLASCQKKTCWKCVIATGYQGTSNVPPGSVSNIEVCDKTKSEIREFEQTSSKSSTSGGYTVRVSTTCAEN